MTPKPKLMILGHAGHGKDTACEILRDEHGYSFLSSSQVALESVIWPAIGHHYMSKEECFNERVTQRSLWFDLICAYNHGDPARLSREILSSCDIYCGIRNYAQFMAGRQEGLFDHAIWIDASGRVEAEDESSMNIPRSAADIIVNNDREVEDLRQSLAALVKLVEMR